MADTSKMYDNLGSLGATPKQVEKSLDALRIPTLRIRRSQMREILNDAIKTANGQIREYNRTTREEFQEKEVPSITKEERKAFLGNVLLNNCVISGAFQAVTREGQVLGCPLTLGFNLTHGSAGQPAWGSFFYPLYDEAMTDYLDDHQEQVKNPELGEHQYEAHLDGSGVAFVLEGR